MATSSQDIKKRISATIPELNNTSNASIWGRIADVVGVNIDIFNLELIRSEQIIENAAINKRAMGREWYIMKAFAYQEGDNVIIIDPTTQAEGYVTIDATKQIIKQCSVSLTPDENIVIKVATSDANGNLIKLTTTQLSGFTNYIKHFIPFGFSPITSSQDADIFKANQLVIYYQDSYSLSSLQQRLQESLKNFQIQFRTDTPLYINDVETQIKSIDGIRDAWFNTPYSEYILNGEVKRNNPIDNVLTLNSGYFNFDPNFYDFTKTLTKFIAVR